MTAPDITIRVNGSIVTTRVRFTPATIRDLINDAVDTCDFLMDGAAPTTGQTVRITTSSDTVLLFNGSLTVVTMTYEGKKTQLVYQCTAQDDSFEANALRPFGVFENVSATTVATSLVTNFAPGFTSTNVQAALATISVIFDGSEGLDGCLRQIAKLIGGYFYWSDGDLHLFTSEATNTPDDIDDTPGSFLQQPPIAMTTDRTRLWTRVYGKGHGESAVFDVAVGETAVTLPTTANFTPTGGSAITLGQVFTYTGLGVRADHQSTWIMQSGLTGTFRAVAWSPSLAIFVAVGTSVAYSSTDGLVWTVRTAAEANGWSAVVWAASLGLFVAVSTDGTHRVMTSSNGTSWSTQTAAAANVWTAITWSASLGKLVAVATTGASRVMTSTNGTAWSSATAAEANPWVGITWAEELTLFVAVAESGTHQVMTSADGTTWATQTAAATAQWGAIAWSGPLGLLAAVSYNTDGTAKIMTSSNGTAWTQQTIPWPYQWVAIVWAAEEGRFVAVSYGDPTDSDPPAYAMTSSDGIVWTLERSPTAARWFGLAWSPALSRYVAVGTNAVMTNDSGNRYETLTGIPASGAGSLAYAVTAGDMVNIWVERNDAGAQATYGIRESPPVVDERRNEDSLTALCDATLELFKAPIKTVKYSTRDLKTKSGKPIVISLANPPISETLTIQDVTIRNLDLSCGPIFDVVASTLRFSLEDVLRRLLTSSSRNV